MKNREWVFMKMVLIGAALAALMLTGWSGVSAYGEESLPCAEDIAKYCKEVKPGGGRIITCLKDHESDLTALCKDKMETLAGRVKDLQKACAEDLEKFCRDVQPGERADRQMFEGTQRRALGPVHRKDRGNESYGPGEEAAAAVTRKRTEGIAMRGAILRRGRRMGRLLAGGILSIVMLMTAVGAPSAEESISVACYFGDRLVGDGVVVFDVTSAAQACNGLFYDCRGRCFGVPSHQETPTDTFPTLPEYPRAELLSFEKELLGLYLTEHPMAKSLQAVSHQANKTIEELDKEIHVGHMFNFGGIITKFREVRTKKDQKAMCFGSFEDESGSIEFVAFPKTYAEYQALLKRDSVVLMEAKVDLREEEMTLMVEKVSIPNELQIEHAAAAHHHEVFIPRKTDKSKLQDLGKLLKAHPGDESVVVLIPNGSESQRMLLPYGVAWSDQLKTEIEALLS